MRRLTLGCALAAALLSGCHRSGEVIRPEPTEESSSYLSSTVNVADPRTEQQLVKGFHEVEQNAWRWTQHQFTVTLLKPEGVAQRGAQVVLHFAAPETVVTTLGPVTLKARVEGQEIGSLRAASAGQYTFEAEVPRPLLTRETVTFDFEVDKFTREGTRDARELGVIVSSIGLSVK